jgi:hypothetical protein
MGGQRGDPSGGGLGVSPTLFLPPSIQKGAKGMIEMARQRPAWAECRKLSCTREIRGSGGRANEWSS